jgi:hypothetical protein
MFCAFVFATVGSMKEIAVKFTPSFEPRSVKTPFPEVCEAQLNWNDMFSAFDASKIPEAVAVIELIGCCVILLLVIFDLLVVLSPPLHK